MCIKETLSNILKKYSDNIISKNTVSIGAYGIEKMPEALKKSR